MAIDAQCAAGASSGVKSCSAMYSSWAISWSTRPPAPNVANLESLAAPASAMTRVAFLPRSRVATPKRGIKV